MLCTLEYGLSEEKMKLIRKYEKESGVNLLAYRCFSSDPAGLDEKHLIKLKELEKELGLTLVALKK